MISCCKALQPNRQLVGKVVYFECPICEFKGDSSTNEAWAMQAWNKRVLEFELKANYAQELQLVPRKLNLDAGVSDFCDTHR